MFTTIFSALAGFLLWTVLWLSSNAALRAALPQWYGGDEVNSLASLVILFASVVFSLAAGYLTASLSGAWRAVIILVVVQVLVGLIVSISYWNSAPIWYHIMFLVLLAPMHLLAARFRLSLGEA